ncbi:carboxypeptidase M32 [Marivibrio halodurans]|uniref:Metal-dependent carboxypeptidase n=1 Tax=Marivibrio halodurans TaxID=2039722 RepID=A0A8J7V264_9PROT|nr:carboxypeptidase M32 [Marivibrio halodurans]MBP5858511.1 carboxypeptidase M32 [Marivibrio halodurans]
MSALPQASPASCPAYTDLADRFRRMAVLAECETVLHWDAAVIMPASAAGPRGDQLAELRVILHEQSTDPALAELLQAAGGEPLDPWQAANLREMRRDHLHAAAVPGDLVAALSRACSACESVWRDARPRNDYAAVAPHLEEVLRLTRRAAAAKADALGLDPYDALMDQFEPDARRAEVDPILEDYAAFLPDFLGEVLEEQARHPAPRVPEGPFPADAQRRLVRTLLETVGFPFDQGRMDESAHPFSTGYPGDSRITITIKEDDPAMAVMAALHECGHALYEANLPSDWARQPVGRARGMAVHESQSLIVEMQACRSPEFIGWLAPRLSEWLGDDPAFAPDNLRALYGRVTPDFIRVEADEVTYPAHVILRYRLEKALLAGDLSVADLPGAWDEGMEALLGIRPPCPAKGCMQDIHWFDGAFGYFPTYTLGAMTAAQLMAAARAERPGIPDDLTRGDFGPLLDWLRRHVHSRASSLSTRELVTEATGRSLDPAAFRAHLRARYLGRD